MADKEKRKHVFKHRQYLELIADRIVSTRPTKDIVYQTLKDVWDRSGEIHYILRIEDAKYFKEKREQHRINSFNMIRDHVDDILHPDKEERPKRQRINQKKK